MLWFVAVCVIPSFLIGWSMTGLMRFLAPGWGLIDRPAARKVHSVPVPLGGGVAVYLGIVIPLIAAQIAVAGLSQTDPAPSWIPGELIPHLKGVASRSGQFWGVIVGATVLMLMGLWDDRFGLSWRVRLAVQLGVAIVLVGPFHVRATVFVAQPWFGMVLTVIWLVLLINALNFLDNMDTLAGGIALIVSLMFAHIMLISTGEPRWFIGGPLLIMAGSVAGFLIHNRPPAKIFLGDAGSTVLGLLLGTFTVLGTFYDAASSSRHVILAPLCILAIPLFDCLSVIAIRLSRGRSPFHADRNHLSHRLVDLGLSKPHAVLTIHFTTLTTGLGALLLYHVRDWTGAALVVAIIGCLFVVITILEMTGREKALVRDGHMSIINGSSGDDPDPPPTV